MALCVAVTDSGLLQSLGDYSSSCAGYALMSATEYAQSVTVSTVFSMPDTDGIQAAFMAGFSLPLILWLTSWGYGVVINFVNSRLNNDTYEE